MRRDSSRTMSTGKRHRLPLRIGLSLMGVFFVAWGAFIVWAGHYDGRTSKLGGAEVHLQGSPALAMGLATLCFGLLPLAVWLGTRPRVAVWCTVCMAAAAAFFIWALHLVRQAG